MPHRELILAGQRVPSVTEWLDVLDKSWLRGWFAKEELVRCIDELAAIPVANSVETYSKAVHKLLPMWRRRVKEKDYAASSKGKVAADIGNEFHDSVEKFLRGLKVGVTESPTVKTLLHEFTLFAREWGFKPLGLEVHVVSKRYVYQGTFDYLGQDCKIAGLGLWDWKTSNRIDDTFGLQIALYAYAYGEQLGWTPEETWEKITHGGTVRLDKRNGQLEHKIYRDLPYLFRVASALREPYDYRNRVGVWEAENV